MNAMTDPNDALPVAVIGAGPVGLAAAAELIQRGLPVTIYEAAGDIAAHLRDFGHVRLFSPWGMNIAPAAAKLLEATGWTAPDKTALPTAGEIYERYLKPLAGLPAIRAALNLNSRVVAISRAGFDKVKTAGRERAPFVLSIREPGGHQRRALARAVIDCSGTWSEPNPLGADGLPVPGEVDLAARIAYGIPDILGAQRARYAGKRVLVVGSGHSAANALLDLAQLRSTAPDTRILWAVRGDSLARLFGSDSDQLAARGALGQAAQDLAKGGAELHRRTRVTALRAVTDGIAVAVETPDGAATLGPVDEIIVATGQRPNLAMLRELRLDLDPWLESTRALGPLIDPNLHSCGSVKPHGHRELAHLEPGFYIAGVKSYGRAPTFLLATGYEQVRSIAAALGGAMAEADRVDLVLPETGVCGVPGDLTERGAAAGGCCGPAAKTRVRVKAVASAIKTACA